jgi:hypothetical protein
LAWELNTFYSKDAKETKKYKRYSGLPISRVLKLTSDGEELS